jgi:hypothetical protein
MKKTLVLNDVKGRAFLIVKGTESDEFATTANQFDAPPNYFRQRNALTYFVKKSRRKCH